ncbi:MAG TPA: CHRD domain-containing protein [Stellaceae bacterium]|nr:CHRD domain-containing protein [Stellaceae bacterium]
MRKQVLVTMTALALGLGTFGVGTFGLATAAEAKIVPFTISLSSKNEVPPPAGAKATGKGTASYDTDTMELRYKVTYAGLTGDPIMAHFHGPAAPGANAGVAVPIPKASGYLNPMTGSATLTEAQAADLMAGKYYFNIHTDANKGGELRGQVVPAKGMGMSGMGKMKMPMKN